ncbi:MAG: MOSC domain-containing protein [Thiomicrospira sp.]|uniref:MOSC domain-containing protein n=1 Tax=Thiomicrospira sp. TaxID=935 RepID=UPI0019F32BD6|nr:MOSC N-terminal beta barrel domain-containing protein [Thiomicrospira sp.]MBE0493012.1 MOSC domain-containing protein [Thiomicrospira sp.]
MFLSEIWRYPLKSAKGLSLNQAVLDPFGLQNDRRWMLVDPSGQMVTQRTCPKMCLISVLEPEYLVLSDASKTPGLVLQLPDQPAFEVALPNGQQTIKVQVWRDHCQAWLADPEASDKISAYLAKPVRLVWFPDNQFRQVDLNYASRGEGVAFADGFPLLLISQASLDDLNQRLHAPVSMSRFRPNLVIAGADAYAEDQAQGIKIGDQRFRIVKPCARCSIPNIDPLTAKRSNQPAQTLLGYRKIKSEILFGQNLLCDSAFNRMENDKYPNLRVGMSAEWF